MEEMWDTCREGFDPETKQRRVRQGGWLMEIARTKQLGQSHWGEGRVDGWVSTQLPAEDLRIQLDTDILGDSKISCHNYPQPRLCMHISSGKPAGTLGKLLHHGKTHSSFWFSPAQKKCLLKCRTQPLCSLTPETEMCDVHHSQGAEPHVCTHPRRIEGCASHWVTMGWGPGVCEERKLFQLSVLFKVTFELGSLKPPVVICFQNWCISHFLEMLVWDRVVEKLWKGRLSGSFFSYDDIKDLTWLRNPLLRNTALRVQEFHQYFCYLENVRAEQSTSVLECVLAFMLERECVWTLIVPQHLVLSTQGCSLMFMSGCWAPCPVERGRHSSCLVNHYLEQEKVCFD